MDVSEDIFEREDGCAKEYQDSLKRQGKARYYCNVKACRLQGPLIKHSPYLDCREDRISKLRQLAFKVSTDQEGKGGSAFGGRFEICDYVMAVVARVRSLVVIGFFRVGVSPGILVILLVVKVISANWVRQII